MKLPGIGIFGGTFDPIHFGHLRLAEELGQKFELEYVYLIPSANPPHRRRPTVDAKHRLEMVKLAIGEGHPFLRSSDCELRRRGPSYSLLTVQELRAMYPHHRLMMLMAMDSYNAFDLWYHFESIIDFVHIVVASREGASPSFSPKLTEWTDAHRAPSRNALMNTLSGYIHFESITRLDISATFLRKQVAEDRSIRFLTPDAVCEYIKAQGLYQTQDKFLHVTNE